MVLPPDLDRAVRHLASVARPLVVGGCVRDWLLRLPPQDYDIEVHGIGAEALASRLRSLGKVDAVGRSFGVYKVRLGTGTYDFSLPRRDSRRGEGHRGFIVETDGDLTLEEAASRRDFTINAISWDPVAQTLIDPLGGEADLDARVLRHCGKQFADDPLRVLRAFQLAGRFGLRLHPTTALLCQSIVPRHQELAVERIWMEWEKWALQSKFPALGLEALRTSGWLVHYPCLAALVGLPQDPIWHPEGDVWTHTALCCEALARSPSWQAAPADIRLRQMLATLCHDWGKAGTTRLHPTAPTPRWTSPGHETAGATLARGWLAGLRAPLSVQEAVPPLVAAHMWLHQHGANGPTAEATRRLARRLHPATIADLCAIMRADAAGRPPRPPEEAEHRIRQLETLARELEIESSKPSPILLGRHLVSEGLRPGPGFGPLLRELFEAQLAGIFQDEAGGIAHLRSRLRGDPPTEP